MWKFYKIMPLLAAVVGMLTLGSVPPASATMMIEINDFTNPIITIADNSARDTNAAVGLINYDSGSAAAILAGDTLIFNTNIAIGTSKPILGPLPEIDLFSVETSSLQGGGAQAGVIQVKLTDPDFAGTFQGFWLEAGGTTQSNSDITSFLDTTNAAFGVNTPLGSILGMGPGPISGSAMSGFVGVPGPYSLTVVATITHTNFGISSVDARLHAVPEPGSLLLLGSGLAGLGLWGWRRKNLQETA